MLAVQLIPLTSYMSTSFPELTQFKLVPQQKYNLLHHKNARPVMKVNMAKEKSLNASN